MKTFARAALIEIASCHIPTMRTMPVVDIFKRPINPANNGLHDDPCNGSVQLNHYFTRSRKEWELKRARGRVSRTEQDALRFRTQREFELHDRNEEEDLSALNSEIERSVTWPFWLISSAQGVNRPRCSQLFRVVLSDARLTMESCVGILCDNIQSAESGCFPRTSEPHWRDSNGPPHSSEVLGCYYRLTVQ